jgi:hypothetical protein
VSKAAETTKKLLKEDVKARPAATGARARVPAVLLTPDLDPIEQDPFAKIKAPYGKPKLAAAKR